MLTNLSVVTSQIRLLITVVLFSLLSTATLASQLSVMSWNIYFDDASGDRRYPEVIKTILNQNPDVVCLQEVTNKFIKQLSDHKELNKYSFINTQGAESYRNIILTKNKPDQSGTITLPTNMNRYAVYIKTNIVNKTLNIINLHLDSMTNDTELRISQLKQILKSTQDDKNILLCGDFNFGEHDKENTFINNYFSDAARDNKTRTYDVNRNSLASKTKFVFEESRRLDRLLTRGNIRASNYHVLITPHSDHYPIISNFYLP